MRGGACALGVTRHGGPITLILPRLLLPPRITEHIDPGLPRVLPLQPRLEEQPRTGLGLPSLRVGRHPNNDIVLTSAGIPLLLSRQHAVVTYDGEQFTVVDLDTTNGTYVRARRGGGAAAWHALKPWVATSG